MRELLLWVAITSATLTSIFVTSHHYSTQGCRASRRAARRTGTKQYSNELCCPVAWLVSAVGYGLSALCVLGFASRREVAAAATESLGCLACGCSAGPWSIAFLSISAVGLATLSVAHMCWSWYGHLAGAVLFFAGGYALVAIELFSRTGTGALAVRTKPALKTTMLAAATLAFPAGAINALLAEWLAILAIFLAVVALQRDVADGDAALVRKADLELDAAPPPGCDLLGSPDSPPYA